MKYDMRSLHQSLSKLIIGGKCKRSDCAKYAENPGNLPYDPEIIYETDQDDDSDMNDVEVPEHKKTNTEKEG
jgi:hypothetical protein